MEKPMFSFLEVDEEPKVKMNTIHLHHDQTLISKTTSQATENEKNDSDPPMSKGEDLAEDYEKDFLVSSTEAKMGQVRQENQTLKHTLSKVLKDYKSLQIQFNDFFNQQVPKSCESPSTPEQEGDVAEPELISLSLGTLPSDHKPKRDSSKKVNMFGEIKEDCDNDQELKLGLGYEFDHTPTTVGSNDLTKDDTLLTMEPPVHSFVREYNSTANTNSLKKDETTPTMEPTVSSLKTERSEDNGLLDQIPLKKARVSVKVICDTQTMNDGCQWRKYGQKIAKGNPCPRAYYRCTVSPSCPVRKHVQRCAEDRSVLITTYEGTHNHPLSASATAMASTTSAAASMLKSTSSTSQTGVTTTAALSTTTTSSHNGMSTYLSKAPQYPFYLPNTTISTYQSHPTITLDLTSNPHFNRPPTSNFLMTAPRFSSSTCLNFSSPSSSSSISIESNYKNPISFSYLGRQALINEAIYPTGSHDKFQNNSSSTSTQHTSETIAAATKALTSSPSFRSALAASITSLIRNAHEI